MLNCFISRDINDFSLLFARKNGICSQSIIDGFLRRTPLMSNLVIFDRFRIDSIDRCSIWEWVRPSCPILYALFELINKILIWIIIDEQNLAKCRRIPTWFDPMEGPNNWNYTWVQVNPFLFRSITDLLPYLHFF